ncbi:hypothetical protein FB451DRAFT_1235048 [Mycena latifolia]|nr:hypothetical protein FB451DRAFT_1235048 [Mycena latifolia]
MSTVVAMPQPAYAYPPSNAPSIGPASSEYKPPELVARDISRTPSPTPTELGVKKKRTIAQRIRLYVTLAVIIAIIALVESYHKQIIDGLRPVTDWLHKTPAGWLIPIVVLIALSFPPLFGHEIVVMLCGLVWGLGIGFGIVAAGTILGEICTFYAFRLCCRARGEKLELTSMPYGTLAQVVREGGLLIAVVVRYSAFPAHFTTAVFSTCGMPFWVFLVAAVVSLPKQLAVVYIGVALASSDSKSNKIQKIVLAVTIVISVAVVIYVRRLMVTARPAVVYKRRKARQAALIKARSEGV